MSKPISSTPRSQSQSDLGAETSSLVSSPSASEQSSASEDNSEKPDRAPLMTTRQTSHAASTTPVTHNINSSVPAQVILTSSPPTVTSRPTPEQIAAWGKFSKEVTAKGELTVRTIFNEHDINELVAWLRISLGSLHALCIDRCAFKDSHLIALADILRENTTLTSLEFSGCSIGSEGAIALANALEINQTLAKLDLSHNEIGNEGGVALAEALQFNTSVTHLILRTNQIGDVGTKALAGALACNTTLTYLDLSCNQIGDDGVKVLADALARNSSITMLDIFFNQISDDGMQAIAAALARNSLITWLDLSFNQIGDVGIKAFADTLAVNTTLTGLGLIKNKLSEAGLITLVAALKINKTLTTLNLNFNIDPDSKLNQEISDLLEINRRFKLQPYAEASLALLVRHSEGPHHVDVPIELLPLIAEQLPNDVLAAFVQEWRDAFRVPPPPVITTTTDATVTTTTTTTTDSTIPTTLITSPAALTTDSASSPPSMTQSTATAAEINALLADPNPGVALSRWIDGHANPAAALNWVDPANGYTLLHHAVAAQQGAVVRNLLTRGIDRQKSDSNNQTAAELAQARADSSSNQAVAAIAALFR